MTSTPIVLAAGEESEGQMANRGAFAVAGRLGTKPVMYRPTGRPEFGSVEVT